MIHHITQRPTTILFLFIFCLTNCTSSDTEGNDPTIVILDQGEQKDSASQSFQNDLGADVRDMDTSIGEDQSTSRPVDMSTLTDADMKANEEVRFFEFSQTDWDQETPCQGTESPPVISGDFEYPTSSQAPYEGKSSREELQEVADNNAYNIIHRWTFDPALRPNQQANILFRNDDKDVHIYIHTVVLPRDIDISSGSLTVLVDYKPVFATYNFSRDRWDNQVFSTQTTGTLFPIDTQFSMMEVILPAELFTEKKVYEISMSQITSQIARPSGGFNQKTFLLNQGLQQQNHPCFEEPLAANNNLFEYMLIREGSTSGVMIFPAHYPAPKEIAYDRLIPAEPGQELRINLSLRSLFNAEGRERTVFLKPLLDGKPLEDEWRVSLSKQSVFSPEIDARKTFIITLPEEPGIYEVSVAAWQDPHLMPVNLDGTFNDQISFGGSGDSSNLLRFEVTDPAQETNQPGK